jgi:Arc/MetJ-type ribon-helix-helix transcriptional regulator
MYYNSRMKTLTVRLPETLVDQIEAESRARKLSKSDVVRERLTRARPADTKLPASYLAIADLIGSVDSGPADRSGRIKHYLKSTGYGRNRAR